MSEFFTNLAAALNCSNFSINDDSRATYELPDNLTIIVRFERWRMNGADKALCSVHHNRARDLPCITGQQMIRCKIDATRPIAAVAKAITSKLIIPAQDMLPALNAHLEALDSRESAMRATIEKYRAAYPDWRIDDDGRVYCSKWSGYVKRDGSIHVDRCSIDADSVDRFVALL